MLMTAQGTLGPLALVATHQVAAARTAAASFFGVGDASSLLFDQKRLRRVFGHEGGAA